MPSHITESRIHGGAYSSPAFAAIFSDTNQVRRWLDVERALAATQAEMGIIPHEAAREIDRAAQVERFDLTQTGPRKPGDRAPTGAYHPRPGEVVRG
ncbi:adenylosuccinate lyase [Pseudomonas aeruginosa]|nr:adenylosuccinate lyase [Pseudomonas aeruginosa]